MKYYVTIEKSALIKYLRDNARTFSSGPEYSDEIGCRLKLELDPTFECLQKPVVKEMNIIEENA